MQWVVTNLPIKVIEGINLHSKLSKNIFYKIFGNEDLIQSNYKRNINYQGTDLN